MRGTGSLRSNFQLPVYIDDDSDFTHPLIYTKSTILNHIDQAGMELVEDHRFNRDQTHESDDFIHQNLKNRCEELAQMHPEKAHLFLNYVKKQEVEIDVLLNKVVATTMVVR